MKLRYVLFLALAGAVVFGLVGCAKEGARIVDGPYVQAEGTDRAVVVWETEQAGDSWVDYGLTTSYGARQGGQEAVRSHRVTLLGLRPGLRYFYRVSSAGGRREGGPFTAGVQFSKGPYFQNVTPSGIALLWETKPAAATKVAYGVRGAPADTLRQEGPQGFREVALKGLKPGAAYRCRVFAGGLSSPEATFHTPAPGDTSFTFLLYGDSRGNPEAHGSLVGQMAKHTFDFVLHSGDFVDDGREEGLWGPQFFDPVRPIALRGPIYPALGNHDKDAPAYYRFFSVPNNGSSTRPKAWYAFDYENAHFVVLDTNPGPSGRFAAGSEQLLYLERDLKASDAQWKFVMFHHPLYSSARHKSDLELQRVLMPLFERYGVDMALTGHDHAYERAWPLRGGKRHDDGVVHVVSGGGGAELYPVGRSPWTAFSESDYHFCLVRVTGSRLDFEAFDSEGNRVDVLTLHKNRATLSGLLSAVKGGDPARQLEAVQELGRTGRLEAAPAIVPVAGAADVKLRRAAAEALTRIGSPEGMGALSTLSGDADVEVRRWAMQGLIDLAGPEAARICAERLSDPDAGMRRIAARGLQRTPLSGAVPALVKVSRDADAKVRTEALLALEVAGGTAAGEALIAALKDQDPGVRRTAFDAVVRKGLQRPAVPTLIDLLKRESPQMRREIIGALGDAGDRSAVPTLIQVLRADDHAGLRQAAAIALLKLKDPGATEALIKALDDSDRRVQTYATQALTVITRELHGDDRGAWKRWWGQRHAPVSP